jgi:hypothetical protein
MAKNVNENFIENTANWNGWHTQVLAILGQFKDVKPAYLRQAHTQKEVSLS